MRRRACATSQQLSAPTLDVIGAGEPPRRAFRSGTTAPIAFGLTIFNIDQEDLYVYELNPANPQQYRYKGGWEPMRVVREQIAVQGGARQRPSCRSRGMAR